MRKMRTACLLLSCLVLVAVTSSTLLAQRRTRRPSWYIEPTPETLRKVDELIEEIRDAEITINVDPRKSRLIRTKKPITRFSITDPSVADIVQHSPTEFELVGYRPGLTTLTIWYPNGRRRAAVQVGLLPTRRVFVRHRGPVFRR